LARSVGQVLANRTGAASGRRSLTNEQQTGETCVVHNLITGEVRQLSLDEQGRNHVLTKREKQLRGECDNLCEWVHPYGWVPEAGCEVHDRDE
jgi:hypothetical protein